MAERGAENNFRRSTQVVAEKQFQEGGTPLIETIADIGKAVIKQGQEAKIAENFTTAQVQVNNLDRQFQVEWAHDPFNKDALEKLKLDKKAIYENNAEGISPFFRRPYDDSIRQLNMKSEGALTAFGFAQTRKNTVTSMNNAIKNSLSQANIDGTSGANIGEAMINFQTSKEALVKTADGILSEPEATKMLEDYNQDYLKTYLSGKAESDPVGALAMLDMDEVKNGFNDPAQYNAMKEAVKTRALKVQSIAIENEVIGNLKNQANIFKQGKPLSYAELQVVSANMSEPAKKFFMQKSGFSDGAKKLDTAQKLEVKAGLIDNITSLMSQDEINMEDVGKLQDNIFSAMSNGSLSEKEGLNLINQLVEPTLTSREERISTGLIDSGNWNPFSDNVGLPVINEFYDNQVQIKPSEGEEEVGLISKTLNNTNKANLYDYYFQALQVEAGKKNMTIAQLNDSGSRSERREIYQRATDKALNEFRANTTPLNLRSAIPQGAIQYLLQNPDLSDSFDEMYGTGAANRILGR